MSQQRHDRQPNQQIDALTLRQWLADGSEIALVDVRDGGPFSRSHLLVASNLPLSSLEVRAPALLPRRDARMVGLVCPGLRAHPGRTLPLRGRARHH